ncbi:peptidoglycan-associated lipoprotein Pal [Granulicella arctica]|uniref:peptidoglycan-associated lipoprotein Pal n=1 Tax=Granulicella arctica TaxID=940613 RepID=UPI0021DF4CE5|nr:peptidoglycan-associated lipoprotein Pal [Granulicella arctica]
MNSTHPAIRKIFTIGAAVVLSAAVGCHKKGIDSNIGTMSGAPSNGGNAPTAVITADPLAIDLGQSVVLNWRTQNADSVSIDGIGTVPANGTQTVSPSTSTSFHLVAKGGGGDTEANVRVTVRVPTAPTAPVADANGDMGSEEAFHQNVQDVYFDYDSYDLRPDAQANATHAASYLQAHPNIKVIIGGYCDERGSAEYNLALGENRANAAKTALVNAGVSASRLRVVSYGKEKQFCTEADESCYQQNRRGQFSLDR